MNGSVLFLAGAEEWGGAWVAVPEDTQQWIHNKFLPGRQKVRLNLTVRGPLLCGALAQRYGRALHFTGAWALSLSSEKGGKARLQINRGGHSLCHHAARARLASMVGGASARRS